MQATRVKIVRQTDKYGNVCEDFEHMMRRFKKAYQESGILADLRNHEFARSPMQKKREKHKIAEARRIKEERKMARFVIPDK